MSILISFLNLLLYLAIIILVACAIKWVITGFLGWPIDAMVYKWSQIVIGLLCIIAIVVWISGRARPRRRPAALLELPIDNRSSTSCRPPIPEHDRSARDVEHETPADHPSRALADLVLARRAALCDVAATRIVARASSPRRPGARCDLARPALDKKEAPDDPRPLMRVLVSRAG